MQTSLEEVSIMELESSLDEIVKEFVFIRNSEGTCSCKKLSGSAETYFQYFMWMTYRWLEILYFLLDEIQVSLKCDFNERTETKTVFSIKIYGDRLMSQIGLSQST